MIGDKIYIVCRHCLAATVFAEYHPVVGGGLQLSEEWIEHHVKCSPSFGKNNLNGDRCFDLFTISKEDK